MPEYIWRLFIFLLFGVLAVMLFRGCSTSKELGESPAVTPEPDGYGWYELPATTDNADYRFVTHFTDLYGERVRNYSFCYDTRNKISYWVAYPLHPVYTEGDNNSSAWKFDPRVEWEYQADLSLGSYAGNSSEYRYERGHQIPNADRKATAELNAQTYYSTNSTPQMAEFNGRAWARLESWVRSRMSGDTLYVVTGVVLLKTGENAAITYDSDKADPAVRVAVPRYYYKVLLQRWPSNPSGYRGIGFWYEHKENNDPVSASYARSIREIEQMTGFDFFHNLPRATQEDVESVNRPQDWGL